LPPATWCQSWAGRSPGRAEVEVQPPTRARVKGLLERLAGDEVKHERGLVGEVPGEVGSRVHSVGHAATRELVIADGRERAGHPLGLLVAPHTGLLGQLREGQTLDLRLTSASSRSAQAVCNSSVTRAPGSPKYQSTSEPPADHQAGGQIASFGLGGEVFRYGLPASPCCSRPSVDHLGVEGDQRGDVVPRRPRPRTRSGAEWFRG